MDESQAILCQLGIDLTVRKTPLLHPNNSGSTRWKFTFLCINLMSPEAHPETRIRAKVVYLGGEGTLEGNGVPELYCQ